LTLGNEKGPVIWPEDIDSVALEQTPHAALTILSGDTQPIGNLIKRERRAVGQSGHGAPNA
jgi:hypothetical protein